MIASLIQSLIVLPPEVKLLIGAVVTFAVATLLNQIALVWPWLSNYLGPYKEQIILAVSAMLITWIESALNTFPQYEFIINAALALLVAVIVTFGLPFLTFRYFQWRGVRAFQ